MLNMNYQNGASGMMESMLTFHDWMLVFVFSISLFTLSSMSMVKSDSYHNRNFLDSQKLETMWTMGPLTILVLIGLPSLKLLYLSDGMELTTMTVKALGHQWYWQYDYPDMPAFNSYLVHSDYRNLEVDNRLVTLSNTNVLFLITAADVLHSWTLPTLAVKADAVPGRVNKLNLISDRPGVYYGQCSEICGSNHSFMPISMESFVFNLSFTLKVMLNKG